MIELLNKFFLSNIFNYKGFFTGILLYILTIIVAVDPFVEKGIVNFNTRLYLYIATLIILAIIWSYFRNKYPQNHKNKIGILIAITTENDKQKNRIRNDFIYDMNKICRTDGLSDLFNIVNLDDYNTVKVNVMLTEYVNTKHLVNKNSSSPRNCIIAEKRYKHFQKKTKFHFIIYGSIKERKDLESKYYIDLNAIVIHKPISDDLSSSLHKDFITIFPKQISFLEKLEVSGFYIASSIIFIGAKYMIGIAALISGDPFIAYKVHKKLLSEIEAIYKPKPPNLLNIENKLIQMLSEELLQQSRYFLEIKNDFEQAKKLLDEAEKIDRTNYSVLIHKSFNYFYYEKDTVQAIKYCFTARQYAKKDATWLYNLAFLNMYLQRYKSGYDCYERIRKNKYLDEQLILNQCISFNQDYIIKNASFYSGHFILGYLYYYKLCNLPSALENFELFLVKTKNLEEYHFLCTKASLFLNTIRKEMELSDSVVYN